MIASAKEFERMATAESKLWWYKILHEKVLRGLYSNQIKKEELIIDMGCGTGGLIELLNQKGFLNNRGIDYSDYALTYCAKKKLNVKKGNIIDGKQGYLDLSPKVLIYNDCLYFFHLDELKQILENAHQWLSDEGLIIINFPALSIFRGTHDISVGIKKRQDKKTLEKILKESGFSVLKSDYWPFLLSPIIYAIRSIQRLKMSYNKNLLIQSDVELPMPFLNNLFYYITKLELYIPKPWGSSAFIVAKK